MMTMSQREGYRMVPVERVSRQTFREVSVPVASLAHLLRLTCRAGVQTGQGMDDATPGLYPRQLSQNENLQ
jgi:hypothetical protein